MKTTTSLDGSTAALATTLIRRAREALDVDGVALLRGVVAVDVLDGLRTAVQSNRDAGRPMSRQVLYTHGPTPRTGPRSRRSWTSGSAPFGFDGRWLHARRRPTMRPLAAASSWVRAGVLFQDLLLVKREGQKRVPVAPGLRLLARGSSARRRVLWVAAPGVRRRDRRASLRRG
jgi:hypothetical protein